MLKFGIIGKIRSGKTTVAKMLAEELSSAFGGYYKIEFSDALKKVTEILYPETKKVKDREKLIAVGQHMRKLDKDVWVNIVKEKIESVDTNFEGVVPIIVSSVRQPNEVKMLKEKGFVFINVVCDEEERIKRSIKSGDTFDKNSFYDYTETALDGMKFDYTIVNDKGLDYLRKCVVDIMIKEFDKLIFESE